MNVASGQAVFAGFDNPAQIGLNVATSAWAAYCHLPKHSKALGNDLTANERLFLQHRSEYAAKLLQPENRPLLTRLADNYAARPSEGMERSLLHQDAVSRAAREEVNFRQQAEKGMDTNHADGTGGGRFFTTITDTPGCGALGETFSSDMADALTANERLFLEYPSEYAGKLLPPENRALALYEPKIKRFNPERENLIANKISPLFRKMNAQLPGHYGLSDVNLAISDKVRLELSAVDRPKQIFNDLENLLYPAAAEAKRNWLDSMLDEIAANTSGGQTATTCLKGYDSEIFMKIEADYGRNAVGELNSDQVLDLARGSILFDNVDQVYEALDWIYDRYRLNANPLAEPIMIRFKDRFINRSPSGYTDLLINFQFPNGHVGEVRLGLKDAWNISQWYEHNFYEEFRYYDRNAKILAQRTGLPYTLSDWEKSRSSYLNDLTQPIYEYIARSRGANIP